MEYEPSPPASSRHLVKLDWAVLFCLHLAWLGSRKKRGKTLIERVWTFTDGASLENLLSKPGPWVLHVFRCTVLSLCSTRVSGHFLFSFSLWCVSATTAAFDFPDIPTASSTSYDEDTEKREGGGERRKKGTTVKRMESGLAVVVIALTRPWSEGAGVVYILWEQPCGFRNDNQFLSSFGYLLVRIEVVEWASSM